MKNNYQFFAAIPAIVTFVIISFPNKTLTSDFTSTSSYKVTPDLVITGQIPPSLACITSITRTANPIKNK